MTAAPLVDLDAHTHALIEATVAAAAAWDRYTHAHTPHERHAAYTAWSKADDHIAHLEQAQKRPSPQPQHNED